MTAKEVQQYPLIAEKVAASRTALVLDEPFFGSLSLRLKRVEDVNKPVESVSLNGSVLFAMMSGTKKMATMLGDKGHNHDGTIMYPFGTYLLQLPSFFIWRLI